MSQQPFFTREGELFIPQPPCRGPWDPKSLNGRVVVALCGFQLENSHELDNYMPARLTVDMYRLPGFAPIEVRTRIVRDGKRIKVIDAELISEGVSYARATSQWLLRGENPDSKVWSPPNWDAPPPEELPERAGAMGSMQVRPIAGAMGTLGKKQLWMRETRELVGGVPLSPFMWAAIPADLANPYSNSGDRGLAYINSDVTLYLHRLPVDAWIGMEVVNHQATDGVAIGQVALYDRKGAIGTSSVCGPGQRRMAGRPKS
ncbi:MAG: thioesterase family protein [Myxococcales bacterium]|nr:thioesterase family protein [Myxococcales bacterium]